ncbi:hypothetical protein [Micromonospora sp. AKA38]|uniref:hypothetical protein n=1 Tax=Micromonospora sp. AKA38 TaxID=2733861 RepID=UPI002491A46C|nr:hypothetical protein [Micromonospora sp. AKA38]
MHVHLASGVDAPLAAALAEAVVRWSVAAATTGTYSVNVGAVDVRPCLDEVGRRDAHPRQQQPRGIQLRPTHGGVAHS